MDEVRNTSSRFNSILKSTYVFKIVEGYKYAVKVSNKKTTAVNILMAGEGRNVKSWFLRFDNPHAGCTYPHLNIRQKFTGFKDPHLKLSPGSLQVAKTGAQVGKFLNLVKDITIAVDGIMLGRAIWKDLGEGTNINTIECGANITGQWVGGIIGAVTGKTIGAFIITGVGPLVGSFALGCLGVHYGSKYALSQVESYKEHKELERRKKLTLK